ncbi:VCBS repeat-containing protein, partial [bacterium]|nr:VCBS repeat-containing protein [bacterium]
MIKTILFTLSATMFVMSWVAHVFNLGGLAHAELSFTDITESAGTGGPTGTDELGGHGVMFCDVDVDGRPDLYITMNWNTGVIYRELFFRNNGGNVFSGEAAERGIDDPDGGSHGACWADLDNDGDYDLFNGTTLKSSGDPDGNNVFRNEGDGYFTDVTPASIAGRQEYTRGVLAFDMDADGDLDLFGVSGYQGTDDGPDDRNEVYR